MNQIDPQLIQQRRFAGVEKVYGAPALEIFRSSHVAVIGLGGVGSWAVEALARTSIGQITLIDLDNVALSNVNRQIHALDETIGMAKTAALSQRIQSINPASNVTQVEDFLTPENISDLITDDFSFVIDCIDNFRVKAALCAHCRRRKIKLLVTGGAGGQTKPQLIKSADLSRTEHDPLLAQVRKLLRQDYNFPRNLKRRFDIPCIYSDEQLAYPTSMGATTFDKSLSSASTGLNCAQGFGSAVTVTASFGMHAGAYVLNKLAKQK